MPESARKTGQEPVKLQRPPSTPSGSPEGADDPNETFCLGPAWFDPANVAFARWLADEHWRYLRDRL